MTRPTRSLDVSSIRQPPILGLLPARCAPVAIVLLALILFLGCGTGEPAEEVSFDMASLYFEPIGYGRQATLSDTLEIAIRSHEVWEAYRDSLRPVAPFDSVDFTQVVVLLAALPQTTSGYSIEFTSVDVVDSLVVAEYVVGVAGEDCLTTYATTVPFQAVLARRTDLPVEFRRSEEEYRCTFGPRRR